jgi:hypothetical protein
MHLLEPEFLDNQGPDNFLVSIPCGPWQLEELISETTLLNPKLDLVNWVHRRQYKHHLRMNERKDGWSTTHNVNFSGTMFDEPNLETEGEFVLFCGGVQIPADGVKGISRTASTPRLANRLGARPLAIVVRVNGEPVRALVDSGSLGDLVSTSLADQLKLRRKELDPLTLQLAVQGSRSKINHAVKVNFSY